jgi:bifunctional DNA-binding transcriptional regulator/antitoxin component of YhaV-PrlF toxin-antitoxin module
MLTSAWERAFDELLQAAYTESEHCSTSYHMTVTVKEKAPLVVPNRVRREAGFKTGDKVEFKVSRGAVTILHKPRTNEHSDMLTPAEAKKLRHALKQVREGKTKPWSQVKHDLGL